MSSPVVELIPLDRPLINLLLDNAVSVYPGCTVSAEDRPNLRDAVLKTRDLISKSGVSPEWGGFLAADARSRRIVGTCAYTGAPAAPDGAVEIAYFTLPLHEGKGYATAMTQALVARARASNRAAVVVAHTRPGKSASGRVLEKSGFLLEGEVRRPEQGRAWLWKRKL